MGSHTGASAAGQIASGTGTVQITPTPPTPATGVEAQVGQWYLRGYSLRNNQATNATVVYIRSGSATGPIIATVDMPASGAQKGITQYFSHGISAPGGIFVVRDGTNAVEGCVYFS